MKSPEQVYFRKHEPFRGTVGSFGPYVNPVMFSDAEALKLCVILRSLSVMSFADSSNYLPSPVLDLKIRQLLFRARFYSIRFTTSMDFELHCFHTIFERC